MARFTDIGVNAVVNGFEGYIAKLEAMSRAQLGVGKAGAKGAAGLGILSSALGVVAVGAAAAATATVVATGIIIKSFIELSETGVETARSFETAFAGVLKTTQGLGTNLFDLTEAGERVFQEFRDLSQEIPLTFEELAGIGELVGQLGVAEEDIIGVSETIAALGVSTDLSINDAALVLTRFANVMSDTGELSVDELNKTASALVFLGNTYKARESEILLTARNIAGAASLVGMSEADVLAIGTAVVEAGVSAEAGGSAIQNTITTIQKAVSSGGEELEAFADITGVTAQEFSDAWEKDATDAFTLFIEDLTDQGVDAITSLDELDLAQRRSIRTLLGISKASVDLRGIIEDSNAAFDANTALAREAEIRYNTLDSQVQIFKNTLRDIAFDIGETFIPAFGEILPRAQEITDGLKESVGPAFEEIVGSLTDEGGLLDALEGLASSLGLPTNAEETVAFVERLTKSATENLDEFTEFVNQLSRLTAVISFLSREGADQTFLENLGIDSNTVTTLSSVMDFLGGIGSILLNIAQTLAIIPAKGIVGVIGAGATGIGALTDRPELVNFGQNILQGLSAEDTGRVLKEIWADSAVDFSSDPRAIENGRNALNQVLAQSYTGLDFVPVQENVSTLNDSVLGLYGMDLQEKSPLFQAETENLFQNQITNAVPAIEETFTETMDTETDFLLSEYKDFMDQNEPEFTAKSVETGEAIGEGIAAGIAASTPKIKDAARKAAFEALAAANAALGARSPAKNAMPIGRNFTEGIAVGVLEATQTLTRSVEASMGTMLNSASQIVSQTVSNENNVNRSVNFGDVNIAARPEDPSSVSENIQLLTALGSA